MTAESIWRVPLFWKILGKLQRWESMRRKKLGCVVSSDQLVI